MASQKYIQKYILSAEDWQLLAVSGKDCMRFLQGHLTCDLMQLTKDNPLLGVACDIKGRVVASMFLIADEGNLDAGDSQGDSQGENNKRVLILLPRGVIDSLLALWSKYMMLYRQTQIDILDGGFELFILQEDNDAVNDSANDAANNATNDAAGESRGELHSHNHSNNKEVRKVLSQGDGDVFINVFDKASSSSNPSSPVNHRDGKDESNTISWNAYLIKHGIPFITSATSGQMTPQMINYDKLDGVSFTKGCYLGQEVVARVHYKGKSARRCYKVSFENKGESVTTQINMPLYSIVGDKINESGKLINYCLEDGNKYMGIALLNSNLVDMQNIFLSKPSSNNSNNSSNSNHSPESLSLVE